MSFRIAMMLVLCAASTAQAQNQPQPYPQPGYQSPRWTATPEARAAAQRAGVTVPGSAIPGINENWPEPAPVDQSPGAPPPVDPSTPPSAPGQIANDTTTDDARPPVVDESIRQWAWMQEGQTSARQQGVAVPRPTHRGFAHSTRPADQHLLARWRQHLLNEGVPQHLIDFEARRLPREEFEVWASRRVWAEQANHPNAVHADRH